MKKAWQSIPGYLPFIVIGLSYAWALLVVGLRVFKNEETTNKKVIVIAHWQLEAGVREGLKEAAAEYSKLHPDVEIRQEAIPDSGYGQWLTIQMLGGTAPDIVEMGMLSGNLMTVFYQKYVIPVTPYLSQPNPYNKGTDLEKTTLPNTFVDAMRQSYIPEVQEYMTIPMARMSVRLLYNKTLLKKLTGVETPPSDFRQFIQLCQKIQSIKQPDGRPYVPISNSPYQLGAGWSPRVIMPATYGAFRDFDYNHNGRPSGPDWAIAFMSGRISLDHPDYRGSFDLLKELSQYFQPGWNGLNRAEAIFKFAQGKAVFIATGQWEVGGLEDLAVGKYKVGIVDFPRPSPDDPVYGKLVEGPNYENVQGSVPFAVTRFSHHPDVAFDFLLFLASRQENEKFNARLHWLPIIKGAKASADLKVFLPTTVGVSQQFNPALGGDMTVRWQQLQGLFYAGQISFDDMVKQYNEAYQTGGKLDFDEFLRNTIRGQPASALFAADVRGKAIEANVDQSALEWVHYRQAALGPISAETAIAFYKNLLANLDRSRTVPLYQYSPEAMKNLRETYGGSPLPMKNPRP